MKWPGMVEVARGRGSARKVHPHRALSRHVKGEEALLRRGLGRRQGYGPQDGGQVAVTPATRD